MKLSRLPHAAALLAVTVSAAFAELGVSADSTRPPAPILRVTATAYCQGGTTQSGTRARTGIVAADPLLLPVGTVLRIIDSPASGIYSVMDTGPAVKGHRIDIFFPDCRRAARFGAKQLRVRVSRHGWNPKASPD